MKKKILLITLIILFIAGVIFALDSFTSIDIFKTKEKPIHNAGALSLCRQQDGSYITVEGNCYEEI